MAHHAYKVVNNYAHDISGWSILSRLIHSSAPNLGKMNGDVQSYLSTLAFNNGEQPEYFHSTIIRLLHEIIISGETVYPKRLLLQYAKALSKSNKTKSLISLNMRDIITLLKNNRKLAV